MNHSDNPSFVDLPEEHDLAHLRHEALKAERRWVSKRIVPDPMATHRLIQALFQEENDCGSGLEDISTRGAA